MSGPLLYKTLKVLLKDPIIILMLGGWRDGKTDTSLLCGHLAKKWGLIDKIGSNIWTYKNPEVEYIITMRKFKKWLYIDKSIKLFLFDEGLKHLYRRKAMSQKNVDVVTEMLPELSKGHGRMILISQIEKLDSDVIDPTFCRAKWRKLNKKTMVCISKHHPPRTFRNLPRSPIRFDKDRPASFIVTKMSKEADLAKGSLTYQIAMLYAKGYSFSQIKREKNLHQEQVKRHIQKALNWFCSHQDDFPEEKEG